MWKKGWGEGIEKGTWRGGRKEDEGWKKDEGCKRG